MGKPGSLVKEEAGHNEPSLLSVDGISESVNNLQAACARTLSRGLALYFSRPVRLFRPAKVTGWQFLKNVAHQEGALLSPSYILQLCRSQGVLVVPKHFLPPMIANAGLGTVLWTSYAESHSYLSSTMGSGSISTAAMAGACAGACQALVAAPAENVRIVLEGGSGNHLSWSCVWKEVFQSRVTPSGTSTQQRLQEIRELRTWLKDVGEMAGRGWDGWRWGCAKDACAFAAFFTVFEITRRTSSHVKTRAQQMSEHFNMSSERRRNIPKIANALSLVGGGVIAGLVYEAVCQPWDRLRRIIYVHRLDHPHQPMSVSGILIKAVQEEGFMTLVRDPIVPASLPTSPSPSGVPPWIGNLARTLARVGPWGIGFLVWEAYGTGLG